MADTRQTINRRRDLSAWPPLPPISVAGFALAIAAVVTIALFSFISNENRTLASRELLRTQQVLTQLQSVMVTMNDAETGQRGYLLTGEESYLGPYTNATNSIGGELSALDQLLTDSQDQTQQLQAMRLLVTEKLNELAQTVALRRGGDINGAMSVVQSDRGKNTMDTLRSLLTQMQSTELRRFTNRRTAWEASIESAAEVTWAGAGTLLVLIVLAAIAASREYRARETEAWVRAGQSQLATRLLGENRLEKLGAAISEFLASYLEAPVAAVYVSENEQRMRRVAGYAMSNSNSTTVNGGEGLHGQAIASRTPLHVRNVPVDHLPVSSALGRSSPRELLIVPAAIGNSVLGVMELGFFRTILSADQRLVTAVADSLAVAIRAAKDHDRLEELLEETQRQAEELQAQQEELRVNNDELREQGRQLTESQAKMEVQQAELEQSNMQLEEQTRLLEHQKDELSNAQFALEERARELERADQYKSEFLANMSHELRTPLNSTLILAKLLADNKNGNLTAEQITFARTITSAGHDLLALINDILDLSKIEAGKIELVRQQVELSAMLHSLLDLFQPMAKEKGLELTLTLDPNLPAAIESDAQRVGQIMKNLLSNALKFTERGRVAVHAAPSADGGVTVSVSDSGIGIPEHQHEIIFEAFRQADGSTHRKYGGTGLGLSISRDLAHLLGGTIGITSSPGQGSIFTLKLPAVAPDPSTAHRRTSETGIMRLRASEQRAATYAEPLTVAPRHAEPISTITPLSAPLIEDDRTDLRNDARLILVIEDDRHFAAILRDLAREMRFQCVVTSSASEGLSAAMLYRPTAIVLDMNLPDHFGLGVLDQLKHSPQTRHIPVHVVSVEDYSQEALALGAIGYALKPVKREHLIRAFELLDAKASPGPRRVLVVEDDARQRGSLQQLLGVGDVEITAVATAAAALEQLNRSKFDCMVLDLTLPDLSGDELLEQIAAQGHEPLLPVIVYTGRSLSRDEEQTLRRFSKSIIIKDARSPERLLDEVTLFLHQVESKLPPESQQLLKAARDRESRIEGRLVLIVEDDVRNIFALSSLLEPKGAKIEIARNGVEAIEALKRHSQPDATPVDLVLMDIMMPEMDGLTATREIRQHPEWSRLPIIALTAKAMPDDQQKCLAAGANDYIAKPLDVDKLLSLIRVWMPK